MSSISVIIPAYNQGHYLGEAIQSVLSQTVPDWEIAVIDDGSTDKTREVVQSFTDPRLRYIYQENRGLSAARNTGIQHTSGPFITFLDSDDCFLPDNLAVLGELLKARPEIGMAAGQAILIDQNGRKIGRPSPAQFPEDLSELLLGNPLSVGSMLLRRTWLDRVGTFDESLRACEDWDLWLRLARAGCQIACIQQPVSLYRVHIGQMTRDPDRMRNAARSVLDKIYSSPDLPDKWGNMRDQVYSRYYLLSSAHLYRAKDYDRAMSEIKEAVRLSPDLLSDHAERLSEKIAIWANDVRITNPIKFLEGIYDHLPDEFEGLRRRRNRDIGRLAMQIAFEAYQRGELAHARGALWRAFHYQPGWLTNRGVLSIFIRSFLAEKKYRSVR